VSEKEPPLEPEVERIFNPKPVILSARKDPVKLLVDLVRILQTVHGLLVDNKRIHRS